MKDMFYNYDNCPDKKDYTEQLKIEKSPRVLGSDSTVKIVKDLKGNEIGIQVKHNNAFTLYFSMVDYGGVIDFPTLLGSSTFTFEVLTTQHDRVFIHEDVNADEIFMATINAVAIEVCDEEELALLDIDSYRMRLTMTCTLDEEDNEGNIVEKTSKYELYPEEAGLLIVR